MPHRAAAHPPTSAPTNWWPHVLGAVAIAAAVAGFSVWQEEQQASVGETLALPAGETAARFKPLRAAAAVADAFPAAQLVSVHAVGVHADGHVDTREATVRDPRVQYTFFQPGHGGAGTRIEVTVIPPGTTVRFAKATAAANVKFTVRSEGLVASFASGALLGDGERGVPVPKCSVARLWAALPSEVAIAPGAEAELTYALDEYELRFERPRATFRFDPACKPFARGRSPS